MCLHWYWKRGNFFKKLQYLFSNLNACLNYDQSIFLMNPLKKFFHAFLLFHLSMDLWKIEFESFFFIIKKGIYFILIGWISILFFTFFSIQTLKMFHFENFVNSLWKKEVYLSISFNIWTIFNFHFCNFWSFQWCLRQISGICWHPSLGKCLNGTFKVHLIFPQKINR